mmetsp:Transcript_32424/g.63444  ORF Transcript_32424/g.63444 Transcript_32424/m.63444 type:complete len:93 (+) Transcript_32424:88-366(+)
MAVRKPTLALFLSFGRPFFHTATTKLPPANKPSRLGVFGSALLPWASQPTIARLSSPGLPTSLSAKEKKTETKQQPNDRNRKRGLQEGRQTA